MEDRMVKPVGGKKVITFGQAPKAKMKNKIPFRTASLEQKVKSLVNRAKNGPANPKKDKIIDAIARRAATGKA